MKRGVVSTRVSLPYDLLRLQPACSRFCPLLRNQVIAGSGSMLVLNLLKLVMLVRSQCQRRLSACPLNHSPTIAFECSSAIQRHCCSVVLLLQSARGEFFDRLCSGMFIYVWNKKCYPMLCVLHCATRTTMAFLHHKSASVKHSWVLVHTV
jgi:hypothetical protein